MDWFAAALCPPPAEVNFGGNNFGPIAIDGIQFHRLDIKLTP